MKIKKIIAANIVILLCLSFGWLLVNNLFIKPIKSIFETHPVNFITVSVVILVYLSFFLAIWVITSVFIWSLNQLEK
jgi:hypothetical protein